MKTFASTVKAIVFVAIFAVVLTSCGKKDASEESFTAIPFAGDNEYALELPENLRFDGESFDMYFAYSSVAGSYISEGENGNLINDAVWKRNQLVEQKLGIKLNFEKAPNDNQTEQTQKIASLVLSGDDTYEAFIHVQHSGMPGLITEGLFLDWNALPHIKLENPWWYSNALRDISFGNKVFAMTGDYNLNTFGNTGCLAFNKDILDELELEYPYQMVFDGTWTHDKFVEYIQAGTKDLNGDGLISWEHDRLGLCCWGYGMSQAIYTGYGGETLKKDENNMPVLNIYNEKQNAVIDKLIEVFKLPGTKDLTKEAVNIDEKVFAEGRNLFNDSFFSAITGMRNYDFDFGFVPFPKMDESQEGYRCRTSNISGLTYLPITNTKPELTGATLEAMAYYSHIELMPKFFDTVLTVQSTRDIESEKMIPIIRESARFMDQAIDFTPNMFSESKQNTLASYWISSRTLYEEKLKTLISAYSD